MNLVSILAIILHITFSMCRRVILFMFSLCRYVNDQRYLSILKRKRRNCRLAINLLLLIGSFHQHMNKGKRTVKAVALNLTQPFQMENNYVLLLSHFFLLHFTI